MKFGKRKRISNRILGSFGVLELSGPCSGGIREVKEKMQNKIDDLSEVFSGRPSDMEESFYIRRLKGINSAFNYVWKKVSYKEEQRNIDRILMFMCGVMSGLLLGIFITNMDGWLAVFRSALNGQ